MYHVFSNVSYVFFLDFFFQKFSNLPLKHYPYRHAWEEFLFLELRSCQFFSHFFVHRHDNSTACYCQVQSTGSSTFSLLKVPVLECPCTTCSGTLVPELVLLSVRYCFLALLISDVVSKENFADHIIQRVIMGTSLQKSATWRKREVLQEKLNTRRTFFFRQVARF